MTGRTVVATGASAGVGRACVRAFAQNSDNVALIARGAAGLEAAAEEVRARGSTALAVQVDVSDHHALDEATDRIKGEGPIAVWVSDAFALAELHQGDVTEAFRAFERNRSACGPSGLLAQVFDVLQRQLRGNIPQAFVHAMELETSVRLGPHAH